MVTITDIMFRIYRNPILRNVKKVDILDYTTSVLKLLNIPATFEEKSCVLLISEFRVPTPKDLFKLRGVTSLDAQGRVGARMKESSDSRILHYGKSIQTSLPDIPAPITGIVQPNKSYGSNTITYKEVPGWLYFDFESGQVEIIYSAFRMDENGYPLIPDNESLLLAIENYTKYQYFLILFETGHIAERIVDRAEQQYMWYMGQAENSFSTPTEDKAESIFNAICRLIPDRNAFITNFKYNSNTEQLKLHR